MIQPAATVPVMAFALQECMWGAMHVQGKHNASLNGKTEATEVKNGYVVRSQPIV